jgi:hypothetical protein
MAVRSLRTGTFCEIFYFRPPTARFPTRCPLVRRRVLFSFAPGLICLFR